MPIMMSRQNTVVQQPSLHTVAQRVHMPVIGAVSETTKPTAQILLPQVRLDNNLRSDVLKFTSANFKFTEDVVKERCSHALPYSNDLFSSTYSLEDIVPTKPRLKSNNYGLRYGHKTSKFTWPDMKAKRPKRLKPIENVLTINSQQINNELKSTSFLTPKKENSFFITEKSTLSEKQVSSGSSKSSEVEWEDSLLSSLHPNTAAYLVRDATDNVQDKKYYLEKLRAWYGEPPELVDLLPDDPNLQKFPRIPSPDHFLRKEKPKRPPSNWRLNTPFLKLIEEERVRSAGKVTDPYDENTGASFYRLPVGIRQERKDNEAELVVSSNKTAAAIKEAPKVVTPVAEMKDFLNHKVGNKYYNTQNDFEREWLTGGTIVHQKDNPSEYIMKSYNRYTLQLQPQVPDLHLDLHKPKKGNRKWKSLPQPEDLSKTMQEKRDEDENEEKKNKRLESSKQKRSNKQLNYVVDEWRKKWHLNGRFADCSIEDLIRDMSDLQVSIRLQAVMTCAKALSFVPQLGDEIEIAVSTDPPLLPETLFSALELLLDDVSDQVRRAAAICLFSLDRPIAAAEKILRHYLHGGNAADRWASAQCLAKHGATDSHVIAEIIGELMMNEDVMIHDLAIRLLAQISDNTHLVHGLLAEQLNAPSWRRKVIVCKTIPLLKGDLNHDITQKLSFLMWNDPHTEVRKSAALALGKTGHGKDVHDDICERLKSESERIRADAAEKLGLLGLMTARLLPIFLQCFEDVYSSVRTAVCITCSRLQIQDEHCVKALLKLATYDPIHKVKTRAIQALGIINVRSPEVQECLLWAIRFENHENVRACAVHSAVLQLEFEDDDTAQLIQERFLVEKSPLVLEKLEEALELLGISPNADVDMVAQIKEEVRRLDEKGRICSEIMEDEKLTELEELRERMIAERAKPAPQSLQSEKEEEDEEEEDKEFVLERDLTKSDRDLFQIPEDTDEEEEEYVETDPESSRAPTSFHTPKSRLSSQRTTSAPSRTPSLKSKSKTITAKSTTEREVTFREGTSTSIVRRERSGLSQIPQLSARKGYELESYLSSERVLALSHISSIEGLDLSGPVGVIAAASDDALVQSVASLLVTQVLDKAVDIL